MSGTGSAASSTVSVPAINESPSDIYQKLIGTLNFIHNNNYVIARSDFDYLKSSIENLRKGNLCYNRTSALLNYRKKCPGIALNILENDVDNLYEYAIKYEILNAPKTVTIGVHIKSSKFFL